MADGDRYIGDRVFDALMEIPGFKEKARDLIKKDWHIGSGEFRNYVEPLINQIPFEATFPSWGEAHAVIPYLERRVVGRVDLGTEPWLWAYLQMTGALIRPSDARFALNAIANTDK